MSTPVCPECILSATIWLSQWQQQRTLWSSSLVLFYLLFLSLCLQIWLRLRRAPARGCWTWRRRRSNGRTSWRTWGSSWGSAQPRARSPTLNYSILFKCTWPALDCATNQRIHNFSSVFYEPCLASLAYFLVGILNPTPDFCRESWRVCETPNMSFRVFRTRWMKTLPRSSLQQCESHLSVNERMLSRNYLIDLQSPHLDHLEWKWPFSLTLITFVVVWVGHEKTMAHATGSNMNTV